LGSSSGEYTNKYQLAEIGMCKLYCTSATLRTYESIAKVEILIVEVPEYKKKLQVCSCVDPQNWTSALAQSIAEVPIPICSCGATILQKIAIAMCTWLSKVAPCPGESLVSTGVVET
jgi:hypothetical protein